MCTMRALRRDLAAAETEEVIVLPFELIHIEDGADGASLLLLFHSSPSTFAFFTMVKNAKVKVNLLHSHHLISTQTRHSF